MSKTVLITGGTRGIGSAIAIAFQEMGYKVVATYVKDKDSAEKFSQQHGIQVIQWDVSCAESSINAAKKIQDEYGFISIIIHNAGITKDSFFHKMPYENWSSVIQTNLMSCFHVIHPFIEKMREQQFGRVVVISSVNGVKGQMGQSNYAAAKAGVIGFVKSIALENAAKGITANIIAPGYIETDMVKAIDSAIADKIKSQIPVGRFGTAEEIARIATFLCDQKSGFITGTTIHANGGQYMI